MENLTKIGILAFIFSIIIVYMSSLSFQQAVTGSALQQTLLPAQNTTPVLIMLPNSTALGMAYYTNRNTVNFAFTNESGLADALASINSSSLWPATSANGSGILEMSYNSAYGIFPYQMQNGTQLVHYTLQSPILAAGNYYAIFHNTGNSPITVYYSTVLKPQSQINSTFISNAAYGAIAMLLFFGGLFIIFYSVFVKKSDAQQDIQRPARAEKSRLPRRAASSRRSRRRSG